MGRRGAAAVLAGASLLIFAACSSPVEPILAPVPPTATAAAPTPAPPTPIPSPTPLLASSCPLEASRTKSNGGLGRVFYTFDVTNVGDRRCAVPEVASVQLGSTDLTVDETLHPFLMPPAAEVFPGEAFTLLLVSWSACSDLPFEAVPAGDLKFNFTDGSKASVEWFGACGASVSGPGGKRAPFEGP